MNELLTEKCSFANNGTTTEIYPKSKSPTNLINYLKKHFNAYVIYKYYKCVIKYKQDRSFLYCNLLCDEIEITNLTLLVRHCYPSTSIHTSNTTENTQWEEEGFD